jgi:hypothetical protein
MLLIMIDSIRQTYDFDSVASGYSRPRYSHNQVELLGADSAPQHTGSLGIGSARPDDRISRSQHTDDELK